MHIIFFSIKKNVIENFKILEVHAWRMFGFWSCILDIEYNKYNFIINGDLEAYLKKWRSRKDKMIKKINTLYEL
jgi:hypothetical protein